MSTLLPQLVVLVVVGVIALGHFAPERWRDAAFDIIVLAVAVTVMLGCFALGCVALKAVIS